MKNAHLLLAANLILVTVLTGCVIVNVSRSSGSPAGDLNCRATNSQSGDLAADFKTLDVDNAFGDLQVVGVETGPTGWSWSLTVRAATDELAQQAIQASKCIASREGERLRLAVTFPDLKQNVSFSSDLEIRAPKSCSVHAKNRYGRTEISDFAGDLDTSNQSGGVDLRNIAGKVRAKNSYASIKVSHTGPARLENQSGAVEASQIQGMLEATTSYAPLVARDIDGAVRARNQSGRIQIIRAAGNVDLKTSYAELSVQEISGDAVLMNQSGSVTGDQITGSVKATTSYSAMDLKNVKGPDLVLQNQSGAIRLQAASAAVTNLQARTSYAPLEIHLPADLKPAIFAQTSYAKVESDFPTLTKSAGPGSFADVPAGTPRVSLQNQSGRIRIVRE